jgi:hypothetical protein
MEERSSTTFQYEVVEIGNVHAPKKSIVTIVGGATATSLSSGADQLRFLLTLRDLVFRRAGATPTDPAKYDRTEVTSAIAGMGIGASELKHALNVATDAAAKKAFERKVNDLEAAGFIDVDRAPGKQNQLRLKP